MPGEGAKADPDDIAALRKRYDLMTSDQRHWCDVIKQQAEASGLGIALGGPTGKATVRRWNITRGLILLAELDPSDALLDAVLMFIGPDTQPGIPLGSYIGALSLEQSQGLCAMADGLHNGSFGIVCRDDGSFEVKAA